MSNEKKVGLTNAEKKMLNAIHGWTSQDDKVENNKLWKGHHNLKP
jgi:hypothetical protein